MNKKRAITACAGILLAGIVATGFYGWYSEHKKVEYLRSRVDEMEKQVMRSAVDRSVSAQMEDIANEQREISDEKLEEALRQTRVANEMRQRSEVERLNALEAKRNAMESEKRALDASSVADEQRKVAEGQRKLAEEQRQLAEHQRIQAEFSRRKADSLSYIALGRSLGSISTIQARAGNDEIANLLCYASYLYTSRYHGDIYIPAVFQSLMQQSQSSHSWSEHIGAVMNVENMPANDKAIFSVSNYGEIIMSERMGEWLQTKTLFKNNRYDFRDLQVDPASGNIFAVSRTGHLVIVSNHFKNVSTVVLDKMVHPMRLHQFDEKTLWVIGESAIAEVNLKNFTVTDTKMLPFRVTLGSRKSGLPLLFDDQGMMHLVKSLENYDTQKVPVAGTVTAYCESKNTHSEAFGMSDGNIWLKNNAGKMLKLIGHRSRISKMKFNGRQLFSSSYDGSMNLWMTDKEKVDPITLFQADNWMMHFCFDSTKNTFWAGDVKGNLTAVNISVPIMVELIRKKLKRNLTTEEWNYYIGQDVPYEPFVGNQGNTIRP